MTDRLDAAIYLARHGAKVFPLHGVREDSAGRLVCTCGNPRCEDAGKHPMAKLAPRGLLPHLTPHEVQVADRVLRDAMTAVADGQA